MKKFNFLLLVSVFFTVFILGSGCASINSNVSISFACTDETGSYAYMAGIEDKGADITLAQIELAKEAAKAAAALGSGLFGFRLDDKDADVKLRKMMESKATCADQYIKFVTYLESNPLALPPQSSTEEN